MKHAWLLILVACGGSRPSPRSGTEPTLAGTYRHAGLGYCGGAAPPRDYRPPPAEPQPGATLQVFSGATYEGGTPVIELVTDKGGRFEANLPAGRYCIVVPGRASTPPSTPVEYQNMGCLVSEWHRCDLVVDVPVKNAIAFDTGEQCFGPCYEGPLPP